MDWCGRVESGRGKGEGTEGLVLLLCLPFQDSFATLYYYPLILQYKLIEGWIVVTTISDQYLTLPLMGWMSVCVL